MFPGISTMHQMSIGTPLTPISSMGCSYILLFNPPTTMQKSQALFKDLILLCVYSTTNCCDMCSKKCSSNRDFCIYFKTRSIAPRSSSNTLFYSLFLISGTSTIVVLLHLLQCAKLHWTLFIDKKAIIYYVWVWESEERGGAQAARL